MFIDLARADSAYTKQKQRAKQRGVEFKLTFEEWINIWLESGHWIQRGKGKGTYNMSRKNDTGAYEVDNVFIQSHEANASDGHKGKPKSAEHNLKNSLSQKGTRMGDKHHFFGKKHTAASIEKMKAARSVRLTVWL